MRRLFPAFVQRRWLLAVARRALEAGRPGSALEILRDELLAHDPRAERLRAMALPLLPAPPPVPPGPPGPQVPGAMRESGTGRSELRELLAELRAARTQAGPDAGAGAPAAAAASETAACARPARLRMSIDDAGTFLLCAGRSATVGHSRAGECDVPILADLLPRHARFVLEPPSFHGGSAWRVEALGSARAWVGEAPLAPAGRALRPGDCVRLALHTRLAFDQPDRASCSATLELGGSLEAAGARRVLLFAPGIDGRLSIGAQLARHVPVNLGGVEVELVHDGERLTVRCASGLIPDAEQGGAPRTEYELPLRLARAEHLRLCMPSASARPRWISFAPLEDA